MRVKAERFLKAATDYAESFRGTYIHDLILRDYQKKTGTSSNEYESWLAKLLPYLHSNYRLQGNAVLDFGCGTGELTVLMNCLGFKATGIDLHSEHLRLARILAGENNLPESTFVQSTSPRLPFADSSFDIITMFVVLEHLDNKILTVVLRELKRVCRGIVFVQVPNKLMTRDDHTGLAFVPWMPQWMAVKYVRLWGRKRRYWISDSGRFDVTYRTLSEIRRSFADAGFEKHKIPEKLFYPPLDVVRPLHTMPSLSSLPFMVLHGLGVPRENLFPYLNIVFKV